MNFNSVLGSLAALSSYDKETLKIIQSGHISLRKYYPSLELKEAPFSHHDGRTVNLLQLEGTIPTKYEGNSYNTPIIIWLLETFPSESPLVYVSPTQNMVIKKNHGLVDSSSGMVSISDLQCSSTDFVRLVNNLTAAFSKDPPLFSKLPAKKKSKSSLARLKNIKTSISRLVSPLGKNKYHKYKLLA